MTAQCPDTCTVGGRKWGIEEWAGPTACVPTNEQLGFRTRSASTANWAGRINHYLVHHRTLYLFKVEVTLAPENKGILPFGARREVLIRYEPMEVHDDKGMSFREREHRFEYLIFDDLIIPFSGEIHLSYPFIDLWELPLPISDEDQETTEHQTLHFKDGVLV